MEPPTVPEEEEEEEEMPLATVPGPAGCQLFGYVGIEAVLDQMKVKTMKMGFEFNIMVVGEHLAQGLLPVSVGILALVPPCQGKSWFEGILGEILGHNILSPISWRWWWWASSCQLLGCCQVGTTGSAP